MWAQWPQRLRRLGSLCDGAVFMTNLLLFSIDPVVTRLTLPRIRRSRGGDYRLPGAKGKNNCCDWIQVQIVISARATGFWIQRGRCPKRSNLGGFRDSVGAGRLQNSTIGHIRRWRNCGCDFKGGGGAVSHPRPIGRRGEWAQCTGP